MFDSIQNWINGIIENGLSSPLFFIATFLLGMLAAVGSCCNLGVMAAVTTYAGAQSQSQGKKSHYKTALSFLLGNIISLSLVGTLTGFVSESLGNTVGNYWLLIAAVITVYFGLITLDFLPYYLKIKFNYSSKISSFTNKSFVFGLALGGFATACSASCNPVFPVILGASYLQGNLLISWLTLLVFAIGYSLPLGGDSYGS